MAGFTPDDWSIRCYVNRSDAQSRAELSRLGAVREIPFPRFWTHLRLSAEMSLRRPDLLFVPSHVIPLAHPTAVVTIHDLGYLHEPESHPLGQRLMLDATTRWNARVARHVIAITHTTKADLVERYGIRDEKITVVHHGVSARFKPATPEEIIGVRRQFGLPDQFVLAVGTIHPRKNLGRLAAAVASARRDYPDLALVLAGRRGWMADVVLDEVRRALPAGNLKVLDYVPAQDLPALYGAAGVSAMVSSYEGFGLPVLEAMACGANVLVSDTPALVEVAGGAAEIVTAHDIASIAAGLRRILGRQVDRRATGLDQAARFTWERTATETIDVLTKVLDFRH